MTARPNSLLAKPNYCLHREKVGSPVLIDTANLEDLFEEPGNNRAAISCKGWSTVQGLVVLAGGASPTIDITPLEHVRAENAFPGSADPNQGFVALSTATAGLANGDVFSIDIDQGNLYLAITAVANSPTEARIYLAGRGRAISITGQQ